MTVIEKNIHVWWYILQLLNSFFATVFGFGQDGANAGSYTREDSEKEVLEINVKGAITFLVVASGFLLLLFYFMSSWFVWLLIVLFCIGGAEVIFYACLFLSPTSLG
jgi:Signal peptide peptidase